MVVVVIVAILATIALPSYSDYIQRSKISEAVSNLSDMRTRLEQFYLDNRQYPARCRQLRHYRDDDCQHQSADRPEVLRGFLHHDEHGGLHDHRHGRCLRGHGRLCLHDRPEQQPQDHQRASQVLTQQHLLDHPEKRGMLTWQWTRPRGVSP